MADWSIHVELSHALPTVSDDQVDAILEALASHGAALSVGPKTLGVQFFLQAPTPARALAASLRIVMSTVRLAAIHPARITEVEIQAWSDFLQKLDIPNIPDLVGVAEVAILLKVSKQRASVLARHKDFPRPIAELASGPIWKKPSILRHVGQWPRKPGRPAKQLVPA